MSLQNATTRIQNKLKQAAHIKARVKFDFGDDGLIHVDTTQDPPQVSHEDKDADTTLICTLATFQGLLDGTQDPNIAFMMGKLKVKGSMSLAMKLNAVLED